ncbi:MAG TPA: gliding motility-associated C-terminal domain-containing protein [Prolixibacteraceae bacterium]|jgi:gliding motility-associated-like protein
MKIQRIVAGLIVVTVLALVPSLGFTQITSIANSVVPTEYSSGSQDVIHVFCGKKGEVNASLTATSAEPASFEWQKYNVSTGSFDLFINDQSGSLTSTISNLQDGAYRVNITNTSGVKPYTAWVFNNYTETTAEIANSDCNSFTLKGTLDTPTFTYIDLPTRQSKGLNKGIQVKWTKDNVSVSTVLTSQVFSPPTKDTDYTLTVTDRFGCLSQSVVRYISIVTKASFTYQPEDQTKSHPSKVEAPLPVVFTNTSENGDVGKYEWFIYKSREDIIKESEANPGTVIDSFLTKIYTDSPIYVFEKPGSYNVKLVSQHKSEFTTCYDTVYIDKFIVVEESFIEAPNFFTPGNGDAANDYLEIRFFSMKTVKISIFNRWGKVVHVWESNNVQGFGPTRESDPQSVWDGKVGGRLATPGVYYYVVEGMGRDDIKRHANGFVHLFREK